MTGTGPGSAAPDSTATRPASRPSTPLRRALGLEWHLHRDQLLIHAALAAGIVLIAVLLDTRLGVVAILLAARLPAALADRSPEDGRQLRGALGISRADAVRARTLMICAAQLLLALAAAGVILLTDWRPEERHWASFDSRRGQEGPRPMTWPDHLVDIGLWSGAILWTHALSGGRAFRPGTRPSTLSTMAQYMGVCLLAGLVFMGLTQGISLALASAETGPLAALDARGEHRFVLAARTGQVITLLFTLGGGALALLLSCRRWVRRA